MTLMQKCAIYYAVMFYTVVALGHIPGFTDSQGMLLGKFSIQLIDDLLHGFSGTWALLSGIHSEKASIFYFRAFGTFYTADAFLGFFTGYAFTDFLTGNWQANAGYSITNLSQNIMVNLPRFILGPVAMYIGFVVSKQSYAKKPKSTKKK